MKLKEILAKIGGINPDFVYYLEDKGYIKPKKIEKIRVHRREYSASDFEIIKLIWKYYKEGFPPKVAVEKAADEQKARIEDQNLRNKNKLAITNELFVKCPNCKDSTNIVVPSGIAISKPHKIEQKMNLEKRYLEKNQPGLLYFHDGNKREDHILKGFGEIIVKCENCLKPFRLGIKW